eukprot:Em0008g301a
MVSAALETDHTPSHLLCQLVDKHVSNFLSKFTNITNSLACIIHSFKNMRSLPQPDHHLLHYHLGDPGVCHPHPFNDLNTTKPKLILDFTTPAFSFIFKERLKSCLYPSSLLEHMTVEVIKQYRRKICNILELLLILANDWKQQRGEIFEFGEESV